jgi:hypothetical protein
MSNRIANSFINQIETHLSCIEELLDDLYNVRADHKDLVDSIREFNLHLEEAMDRVADLRKGEEELQENVLSPSLIQSIEEHAANH